MPLGAGAAAWSVKEVTESPAITPTTVPTIAHNRIRRTGGGRSVHIPNTSTPRESSRLDDVTRALSG
jgi:hypothetical protein